MRSIKGQAHAQKLRVGEREANLALHKLPGRGPVVDEAQLDVDLQAIGVRIGPYGKDGVADLKKEHLGSARLGARAHGHAWGHAVHGVGVAGVADATM